MILNHCIQPDHGINPSIIITLRGEPQLYEETLGLYYERVIVPLNYVTFQSFKKMSKVLRKFECEYHFLCHEKFLTKLSSNSLDPKIIIDLLTHCDKIENLQYMIEGAMDEGYYEDISDLKKLEDC
jgi:hypothetical protein